MVGVGLAITGGPGVTRDLPRLAAHVRACPQAEREETLAEGLATLKMVVDQRSARGDER